MKYTMQCNCGQVITVDAMDDAAAVEALVVAGKQHMAQTAHPDVPANMTDDQMRELARSKMKKVEETPAPTTSTPTQ